MSTCRARHRRANRRAPLAWPSDARLNLGVVSDSGVNTAWPTVISLETSIGKHTLSYHRERRRHFASRGRVPRPPSASRADIISYRPIYHEAIFIILQNNQHSSNQF